MSLKADYLKRYLTSRYTAGKAAIEKLATDLVADPAYALAWSNSGFKAAAKVMVCTEALNVLNQGGDVLALALTRTVENAAQVEFSSSTTSNLMDRCVTAEWAELYSVASANISAG